MKSIIVFIVLVALCVTSVKAVDEMVPVYEGPQGYLLDSKITLTPFSVEKGVDVTKEQLNLILNGGKLFRDSKEEKHWVNPYTLSISQTSTEHIALVGTTVRKVKETVVLKEELFNLFYLSAIMYIALMCTIPMIPFFSEEKDERIYAGFICITVVMAICSLVSHDIIPYMFKSFGGALAANVLGFVATLAALTQLIGKHVWWKSIVGIIAMVIMLVIVYF